MSLSVGDIIEGKYRILRLLGEGGMGAVYEGENVRIHRKVAIKVLHAAIALSQEAVQRFEREAQAAGRIGSEHIVEVLDLGNLPSGDRFMVMEFLDGQPLSARIKAKGRLTPHEIYPIARQILQGLAAAHGAGIIHRDLKPDNIYLLRSRAGQQDFVKLLDFGISKFNTLSGDSAFSKTRTGAIMGTPYYMSPEQAQATKSVDHRADLYAIGVVLYESITGRVPFEGQTFNQLLFKIVFDTPPPIEQLAPDCDAGFAAIVQKAMARDPNHRYSSAQEFQTALDEWVAPLGAPQQPIPIAASHVSASSPPVGASSPPAASAVAATGSLKTTGGAGAWTNTGAQLSAPAPQAGNNKTALIAATAAGMLLFAGIGFGVLRLTATGAPTAPSASPATTGSSMDAAKAAAEEARRVAEQSRKAAEELRMAEQKATEAEERAQQAKALLDKKHAQEEAQRQRDNVTRPRAAASAPAQPAATAPPNRGSNNSTAKPASTSPNTARTIRTEL